MVPPLPPNWVMALGVLDLPEPMPMPALAFRVLRQLQERGCAYVENDGSDEMKEAIHMLIGILSQREDVRCLQETLILFQPATIANADSAKGWLFFGPERMTVQ